MTSGYRKSKKNTKPKTSPERARFKGGPRKLSHLLPDITRDIFQQEGFASSEIITRWGVIAGPEIAAHSCPEKITFPRNNPGGGSLHLRVESAFALEIQHLEPVLLERINRYYGYQAMAKIILKQGPLPEKPEPTTVIRRELDEGDKDFLEQVVSGTKDSELKQALRRLGESILSLEKDRSDNT